MPVRGVKSPKRKRQYEHIKESARSSGKSPRRAKEIAARTVNKQRREAGQTKAQRSRKKTTGKKTAGRKTARKTSGKTSPKKASRKRSSR